MFKKIIILLIITILIARLNNINNDIYNRVNLTANMRQVTNIGVSLFNFNDPYISDVKRSLEDIQNKNKSTVNFTFLDGKDNQSIQNETIDYFLNNNYDLLLLNLVDVSENSITDVITKVKKYNKPVILFNIEPETVPPILKSYDKAIIISTNARQSGELQGNLLVNMWNANKSNIDKNNDNTLQYILLEGKKGTAAFNRTQSVIKTINNAGIKTQELALTVCNWSEECGKTSIEQLFLRFGNKIEAIISNNDAMGIGAIEALQEYGYNAGGKSKDIPVVGIDGISKAKELINKGSMAGTVTQKPYELANALYIVGMNLVNNQNPLEGTDYKFNESKTAIEMPYYEYSKNS